MARQHTFAEAWKVLEESKRLSELDAAKHAKVTEVMVNARAAATSPPPAPSPEFMDLVLTKMAGGMRKSQACSAVAKSHPHLHRKYLDEFNAKARASEQRKREKAAAIVHARQGR